MSKISVQENDTSFDYDIYMNNILNHQGYRFFQASFDPDELGTILSVNKDFYGTFLTYVGYIILYISLLTIMFYGRTRFKDVAKRLNKLTNKRLSTFSFSCSQFSFFPTQQSQSKYFNSRFFDKKIYC